MIYITGDTHGGFQRFNTKNFPQQKQMSRSDYAVVTGDFEGVWDDSPKETYWLDWLEEKPFTSSVQAPYLSPRRKRQGSLTPLNLLSPRDPLHWARAGAPLMDGNHENFDRLGELPVHQWQSGKVRYIRPHVLHLMRGQVFEIGGIAFFTMGGAASHDIQDGILDPASPDFEREYWFKRRTRQIFRVKGASWWPEELPSEEEYEEAVRNLKRVNWKVDCILTHCAPTSIQQKLDRHYTPDRLTDFLQMVKRRCQFDYWFLGHYHRNCVVDDRFIVQWEQMVELQLE